MVDLHKLVNSFRYAFSGMRYAFKTDQNLIVHFYATIIVILLSVFFKISAFEAGMLIIVIILVIAAEMINTAIEKMVDLITTERRENAKIAKDISSAMVLVTVVGAVIAGIFVFTPYIFNAFL